MRYASLRSMDISNGRGIGVALFVQGCPIHCRGCFNQSTWDFLGGKEWTEDNLIDLLELASKPYIKRVSILGGEPLAMRNIKEVFHIIEAIRQDPRTKDKKIWIYTGFYKEELPDPIISYLVDQVDYLVEGRFEIDKQDLYNDEIVFAGSSNQKVLKLRKKI